MKVYLACYDIEEDRIRGQVAALLGEYGQRVQKSVFELRVKDEAEFARLKGRLTALCDEPLDIRLYPLCAVCREASTTLSGQPAAAFPAVIIV